MTPGISDLCSVSDSASRQPQYIIAYTCICSNLIFSAPVRRAPWPPGPAHWRSVVAPRLQERRKLPICTWHNRLAARKTRATRCGVYITMTEHGPTSVRGLLSGCYSRGTTSFNATTSIHHSFALSRNSIRCRADGFMTPGISVTPYARCHGCSTAV